MNPPQPRRILITTVSMTTASGTVTYTRDLALALLRRGWLPIVYTLRKGAQAAILDAAGIPVVTSLDNIGEPPDVIHGHHALETLAALLRFPGVPALFVSHDGRTWHSIPPRVPRIRIVVAVDHHCRDRIVHERGFSAGEVRVVTNAVDLARFRPRPPLPPRPKRALVFSNLARESSFVAPIREACAQRGIAVDVVGAASGAAVDHPEEILPQYDLVFGKARCAIEAAVVGTAVIACDALGISGMITTAQLEEMHRLNFGRRTLQFAVTAENVLRELDRYDAADATEVSARVRAWNDADVIAEQFISMYEELLSEPVSSSAGELRAISAHIERMADQLYAQMETGAKQHHVLSKVLNSKLLAPALRFAWRLKRRARG
jgi:hypothetical protein